LVLQSTYSLADFRFHGYHLWTEVAAQAWHWLTKLV